MTTNQTCRVLRCDAPAAWRLNIADHGKHVTSGNYCCKHVNVPAPQPGRRITLDALDVLAVTR